MPTVHDHGEDFWVPSAVPLSDTDLATFENDQWRETDKEIRDSIIAETADILHKFTHIEGQKGHDETRVRLALQIADDAPATVQHMFNMLEGGEVSESVRLRMRQTLLYLAVVGIATIDTSDIIANWDSYKQEVSDVDKFLSVVREGFES